MGADHHDAFPCYYPRLRVFRGLPPLRPLRRDAIRLALLVDRPPRFPISDRKFRTARLIVIKLTFWPFAGRLSFEETQNGRTLKIFCYAAVRRKFKIDICLPPTPLLSVGYRGTTKAVIS